MRESLRGERLGVRWDGMVGNVNEVGQQKERGIAQQWMKEIEEWDGLFEWESVLSCFVKTSWRSLPRAAVLAFASSSRRSRCYRVWRWSRHWSLRLVRGMEMRLSFNMRRWDSSYVLPERPRALFHSSRRWVVSAGEVGTEVWRRCKLLRFDTCLRYHLGSVQPLAPPQ